ncbi:MAG: hypothetical protein R3275_09650 [Saprospiraceae bacterium]|nr:hypothetical protein [Saprospiraceae bacterium]
MPNAYSTDQEDKAKKKERVRMRLSYTNMSNNGSRLLAAAKAKIDRSYAGVKGLNIRFYHDSVSSETYFGKMITDERGEANYPIPEVFRKSLKYDSSFVFIAVFEGNDEYRSADADVEIRNAISKITFEEKDSLRYIKYFVGTPADSAHHYVPAEGVEARIYVKRLFGLLPISEEFSKTDENGMLTIEFPGDIKGDENGEVIVVGKVNDHFEFGNLQYAATSNWAEPLAEEDLLKGRELWSAAANAPYPLVLAVNVMLLGIWGTIVYIIYQMIRIKRLGAETG